MTSNISIKMEKNVEKESPKDGNLIKRILRLNALACSNYKPGELSEEKIGEAENESQSNLKALNAEGGLQEMLAAQVLSIHHFQQFAMALANNSTDIKVREYFTNTAIKLANCFTQQANLLSRLQGIGGQKITIERVDVHHGGQAIVGNITGGTPTGEAKI